jgi:hypothetical protein
MIYTTIKRLVLYTVIVIGQFGCTTIKETPPIYIAAGADTLSTAIAIHSTTGVELNPLGFGGATIAKGIYLFGIRPGLSEAERGSYDRVGTAMWSGAAANNVVQIMFPGAGLVGLAIGVVVGREIWSRVR